MSPQKLERILNPQSSRVLSVKLSQR